MLKQREIQVFIRTASIRIHGKTLIFIMTAIIMFCPRSILRVSILTVISSIRNAVKIRNDNWEDWL